MVLARSCDAREDGISYHHPYPGSAVDGHMSQLADAKAQVSGLSVLADCKNAWAHDLPCRC